MRLSTGLAILAGCLVSASALAAQQRGAAPLTATIDKPTARTVTGGFCRIIDDRLFSANWGNAQLPTLAFTIGPGAAMADAMKANKEKFHGPGTYPNEILAVYLGKTALEDSYGGLGTVVFSPDGHSGTFVTNDKKASGKFDCGMVPKKQE